MAWSCRNCGGGHFQRDCPRYGDAGDTDKGKGKKGNEGKGKHKNTGNEGKGKKRQKITRFEFKVLIDCCLSKVGRLEEELNFLRDEISSDSE